MAVTASGRRGDTAGITMRELGCRSHEECRNGKEDARDLEENMEHNSIVHIQAKSVAGIKTASGSRHVNLFIQAPRIFPRDGNRPVP